MKFLHQLAVLLVAACSPTAAMAQLLYPAPVLESPQTIELANAPTVTKLADGKDYIVKLPAVRKMGSTSIIGGRNVVMIGGEIGVPKGDDTRRAIYLKGQTGTVHIEGVKIDVSSAEADAIAIAAPDAVVQIQRVYIKGVNGFLRTWHADIIQPWGGVKKLLVDQMTAYSAYQGLQFTALTGPIGEVKFSRVNLFGTGKQVWTKGLNGGNGGYLLYMPCNVQVPIILQDVYLKGRAERAIGNSAYPPSDKSTKCPSRIEHGLQVFPSHPVKGGLTLKARPLGNYVPEKSVGLKYKPE